MIVTLLTLLCGFFLGAGFVAQFLLGSKEGKGLALVCYAVAAVAAMIGMVLV